ncbi:aspartate carbamoyltransferase [Burkholderia sp. Bp9004]|uniref:aspartate carbamoyltransferase n=1 Tax=Burkholderia sp. Bp9004 TaxID=2184559 RepID=UPI000F5D99E2|nr:aspartate carbamoyltransferase [Burkholderia sp. Bp9004]RQZ58432.1 aspartate carbamoyltransferase [Burkholderia sp. Bp9004]
MKKIMTAAAGALIGVSIAVAGEPEQTTSHEDTMSNHDMTSHRAEVARKGATVMPFDLARTTHFFDDTGSGGIETITANDKHDTRQVALIRSHLAIEAQRFRRGDFADPAAIHGLDMAGLATLTRAGEKLHIEYRSLPSGASLTYASNDPDVIAAVHAWFAAQRSDHAAHSHLPK